MLNIATTILAVADPAQEAGALSMFGPILSMGLIFVVFYFMMIRPQRKREKEVQRMRSQIEVGDEIVTAGGIIGRVVIIKDDTLVIETGSDRSKIRIAKWAVQTNNTVHDNVEPAK